MATETESPNRREHRSTNQIDRKHRWETANRWWTFAIKGVLGLAAILTFAVITNLLYEALFKRSVVIEPISVPKDMEANGYTPDVAALHLLDAMEKYVVRAHTGGTGPKLALHKDQADFVLPNVGLSFKAVVAQIRTFIPIGGSQNISGEIMRVGEKLRLRLRKNAVVIYERESPDGVDAEDLKKDLKALFSDAALGVFAATHPYFEAVANSDKNPEAASELAKKIIAARPSDWPLDQNVGWAHNLLGLLLYHNGKFDDQKGKRDDQECKADDQMDKLDEHTRGEDTRSAIKEFKWVIHHRGFRDHDRRLAIAHLNLGLAYIELGRADCAKTRFDKAIRIDPQLGIAYLKLGDLLDGDVLNQTGEAEKAPCAYLEAIAKFHQDVLSDPFSAAAHQHLGDALTNKPKADNCATNNTSNEKALKELDPYDSAIVQRVLEHLGPYDNVIAEYQRAAELDPDDAHIHYDLGVKLLESPGLVDNSIEELQTALKRREGPQEALKRREGPSDSFDEFKYVLLKTLSHALRVKARNREAIIDCLKGKVEHQEADELFCQAFRDNEALIERAEKKALADKKPNDNAAAFKRRGADLYLMGKFKEAVDAHKIALGIDETYLADMIERGYALFGLADFAGAVDDFDHALHLPQGQADTMIWLYLSRAHSRNRLDDKYDEENGKELQRNASKLLESNRQDWPVPIIKLFLSKQFNQSPADALKSAEDVLKSADEVDKCKAYFYVGEWHALDKRLEEASKLLKQAEQICQFDSVERRAAQVELERLPIMARPSPP